MYFERHVYYVAAGFESKGDNAASRGAFVLIGAEAIV
jgi:hypothetical protein